MKLELLAALAAIGAITISPAPVAAQPAPHLADSLHQRPLF